MFENRLRVQERIRDMTELMEEIRKRIVFFDGGTGSHAGRSHRHD